MGLIIRGGEDDLRTPKTFEPKEDCIVCQYAKQHPGKNDLEAIFGTLQALQDAKEDLSSADDNMCDYHTKKTQGLKIFTSKDELFEMDGTSTKILKGVPDYNRVSEDRYNSKVEIEDGEADM